MEWTTRGLAGALTVHIQYTVQILHTTTKLRLLPYILVATVNQLDRTSQRPPRKKIDGFPGRRGSYPNWIYDCGVVSLKAQKCIIEQYNSTMCTKHFSCTQFHCVCAERAHFYYIFIYSNSSDVRWALRDFEGFLADYFKSRNWSNCKTYRILTEIKMQFSSLYPRLH